MTCTSVVPGVWFHVCRVVCLKVTKSCICLSSFLSYFGLKGGLVFKRKFARLLPQGKDIWSHFDEIIVDKHQTLQEYSMFPSFSPTNQLGFFIKTAWTNLTSNLCYS